MRKMTHDPAPLSRTCTCKLFTAFWHLEGDAFDSDKTLFGPCIALSLWFVLVLSRSFLLIHLLVLLRLLDPSWSGITSKERKREREREIER
jgi:hypothetical protein